MRAPVLASVVLLFVAGGALVAALWVARTTPHLRNYRRDDDALAGAPLPPAKPQPQAAPTD